MSEATGIVDSHIHLLPDRLARAIRAFFEQNMVRPEDLAYPLDHVAVLDTLQAAGVSTVWTLPYAHKPGVAAGMNKAIAEIVKERSDHPVKMIGGATVHVGDDAPDEIIKEAIDLYGARVLKLHCSVGNFSPDDVRFNPVWQIVSERRLPVVIHLGHSVSGHTAKDELAPLERVAQNFPEARLIIAHCGHIAGPEALDLVEKYPQVHADLTPVVFEMVNAPGERIEKLAGKILFGSDAPNTGVTVQQCLEHVRGLKLSAAAEASVLGGTARRLVSEVIAL